MTHSITTECTYMEHESGTKFYEVVLINAADLKKFLVIKRWGKLSAPSGGGETQVHEYPTHRAALAGKEKFVGEKAKRGYAADTSAHGLHSRPTLSSTADIQSAIKGHYTKHWPMVLQHLGLDVIQGREITGVWMDEADDSIVSEEPEPEPERGDSWGSW